MSRYQDTCRVCGKQFENSHERALMYCSVGCQFGTWKLEPMKCGCTAIDCVCMLGDGRHCGGCPRLEDKS